MIDAYIFCVILEWCIYFTECAPIPTDYYASHLGTDVAVSFLVTVISIGGLVLLLIGCACCKTQATKLNDCGHQNGLPLSSDHSGQMDSMSEFTIFPPSPLQVAITAHQDEVTFEPLPEIRPRSSKSISADQILRPAHFSGSVTQISVHDWFDGSRVNFPRNQLQYLQEVGTGWFGQAVEGEARNIIQGERKTRVVVKILRVDASPSEHMHFLHEVRPFRDLHHPNVLKFLGCCLEADPFLIILEHCSMDLKTYLIHHRSASDPLLQNGLLLRMSCNIASALQNMHEHGFIHTDLAAHSCLVTPDHIVKIGDYGTSIQTFKDDYYCLGDIALPLRWCAPESLHCTENTIETKEITREANMWSFGVLLWELIEFGKLPYMELSDEQVLQKVIIDNSLKLEQPKTPCVHKDRLYQIMQLCWSLPSVRPLVQKVVLLLNHLYDNKDIPPDSSAFEARWNSMQPVAREHNLPHSITPVMHLKFESDFTGGGPDGARDCDSFISSDLDKSPSHGSLSTAFDVELATNISPSLQNLRGSFEDLSALEERLTGISQNADGMQSEGDLFSEGNIASGNPPYTKDEQSGELVTAQQITDAIRDLDNVLANEPTSSETSKCTTPEKDQSKIHPIKSPLSISNKPSHPLQTNDSLIEAYVKENMSEPEGMESSDLTKKTVKITEEQLIDSDILEKPTNVDFFKITAVDSEGSSDTDASHHQSLQEETVENKEEHEGPWNLFPEESASEVRDEQKVVLFDSAKLEDKCNEDAKRNQDEIDGQSPVPNASEVTKTQNIYSPFINVPSDDSNTSKSNEQLNTELL